MFEDSMFGSLYDNDSIYCSSRNDSGWCSGSYQDYTFCAKVYDEPSDMGINNGNISKLEIRQGEEKSWVAQFDRGWSQYPTNENVFDKIYDHLCRRFK